jgi:acetyl-CoA C-acetyltransferase
MIASGQAHVVIAGGAEAWSRAPIRQQRPLNANEPAMAYERPPFAPDPTRDPDLLHAAALYAQQHQHSRAQQNAYAQQSHARALQHQAALQPFILPIAGVVHDVYPRDIADHKLHRMPLAASIENDHSDIDCGVSHLAVSAKADGAAFVLLMSPSACQQFDWKPKAQWLAHASVGCEPDMPLLAAQVAAQAVLKRTALQSTQTLQAVELHDAFAVQGISFNHALSLTPDICNSYGGGLARGHPIGASGAVALVQLLTRLSLSTHSQPTGMVTIAAAGGLGSAALVYSLKDDAAFTC